MTFRPNTIVERKRSEFGMKDNENVWAKLMSVGGSRECFLPFYNPVCRFMEDLKERESQFTKSQQKPEELTPSQLASKRKREVGLAHSDDTCFRKNK